MILGELGIAGSRAIIPHVDDLGASHGANLAFVDLAARGLVTCGSVMVPGPWFREVVEAAHVDTSLDIGVHLTLTSEWKTCRWAPISTVSRASGLIKIPDPLLSQEVEADGPDLLGFQRWFRPDKGFPCSTAPRGDRLTTDFLTVCAP